MKISIIFLIIFFAPGYLFAINSNRENWQETINSDQGQFSILVQPKEKRVEIKKIAGDLANPPHLRIRMLRKNDRPLEIRLKTIEQTNSPLLYTGQLKQWNDSYIGLEVEFSFDKKTWKKLGGMFRKVMP